MRFGKYTLSYSVLTKICRRTLAYPPHILASYGLADDMPNRLGRFPLKLESLMNYPG